MDEYLYFYSPCHIYTFTGSLLRYLPWFSGCPYLKALISHKKQFMVLWGPKLLLKLGLPESFFCNWKLSFGFGSVASKGTEASKRLCWTGSRQRTDSSRGDELIFAREWEAPATECFCWLLFVLYLPSWRFAGDRGIIYIHMRGKQNQVGEIQTP